MSVIEFPAQFVYVILGIDENEHDQVLYVCDTFDLAKQFCLNIESGDDYFDLWIEKHPINRFFSDQLQ